MTLHAGFDLQTTAGRPVVGLVPLRSPGTGKSRLAPRLSPKERAALSLAMLADVSATLRSVPLDRVVVAASGLQAAKCAAAMGLEAILDPPRSGGQPRTTGGGGLDTAVDAVCRRLGIEVSLLVVMADLPRLRPDDVAAVLGRPEPVVVAPTSDGGTAVLLRRPPLAIPSAFGTGSAARHLRLATARGLEVATVDRAGLRNDVDTWADLQALAQGHVGDATASFLERLGSRLEVKGGKWWESSRDGASRAELNVRVRPPPRRAQPPPR